MTKSWDGAALKSFNGATSPPINTVTIHGWSRRRKGTQMQD